MIAALQAIERRLSVYDDKQKLLGITVSANLREWLDRIPGGDILQLGISFHDTSVVSYRCRQFTASDSEQNQSCAQSQDGMKLQHGPFAACRCMPTWPSHCQVECPHVGHVVLTRSSGQKRLYLGWKQVLLRKKEVDSRVFVRATSTCPMTLSSSKHAKSEDGNMMKHPFGSCLSGCRPGPPGAAPPIPR